MRTTTTTTKTEMAQKCLLDKICKNCSQNMVRVLLKQLFGEKEKIKGEMQNIELNNYI